ncbi:GntR family transcriptional regulator [Alkalibacterium subtropicum]|uniref:GntR family transcriptional regulator n=1 Tax=Alkalibacterium subtropicum TaxID=753702 RepID=A0A1I1K9X5_9LACT|nr:GntR family transcriptional regulator [Alkalibacterium subtropicum]SFC57331.1 GntR family transcriptional regulator [Alkalibacterium subtropicum]
MKKYEEIYTDIKGKIINGDYTATEQLPFEKDLCEAYNTSKMTVKRALDLLVDEGLIIKRRGSGTFVKDLSQKEIQRITNSAQLDGFTANHSNNGHKVTSKILAFEVIQADDIVQDKLNLKPGSFVYNIHRVRCVDGKPAIIEKTAIPIERAPGLERKHLEASLYDYIKDELGLTIQSAHRRITVKKADEDEARHLEVDVNDPIGVTEQITYLDTGDTIEFGVTKHRADSFVSETIVNN